MTMKPLLTDKDFQDAADLIGCEKAAIQAVAEVESSGAGFLSDDRPKILFEAHIFSSLTNRRYDTSHPTISVAIRNPKLYSYGAKEHERLALACSLNREAGLKSASWGKFQIMGFNYQISGFASVQDFINAMYKSEREHLFAFVNFIKSKKLAKALQSKDWATFAYYYNGAAYKENKYDEKMKMAYEKFSATS